MINQKIVQTISLIFQYLTYILWYRKNALVQFSLLYCIFHMFTVAN